LRQLVFVLWDGNETKWGREEVYRGLSKGRAIGGEVFKQELGLRYGGQIGKRAGDGSDGEKSVKGTASGKAACTKSFAGCTPRSGAPSDTRSSAVW